MAAYYVKSLHAHLEVISRHLGFSACLGVRLFFSMTNQLKMAITCLFLFGLGVVVTSMAYNHFRSLSTYVHVTSGGLSLLASDPTDCAEILCRDHNVKRSSCCTVFSGTTILNPLYTVFFRFYFLPKIRKYRNLG